MSDPSLASNPGLAVAIAMAAGILVQAVARRLKIPGIVLLIGAGVVLGPDMLGVVQPGALGPALLTLVGFAVAVILFEGGLNLNLRRLLRAQQPIRKLVSLGAVVTLVGGTLAAKFVLGWDLMFISWKKAVTFFWGE